MTQKTWLYPFVVIATGLALSGCKPELSRSKLPSFQDLGRQARVQLRTLNVFTEQKTCKYGDPTQCPPERVCAFVEPDIAECIPRYSGSTPFVKFPFAPDHPVRCTLGPQSAPSRPHSTQSALFALDLTTPFEQAPGTVHAASEGTALVYQSCKDPSHEQKPEEISNDSCGEGFGNHVRILSPSGLMTLYAHLGPIWVQDGQVVKVGEAIGREGKSGKAGHRTLHFSVHFQSVQNWLEALAFYRSHPGIVPPSIPFELQYCDPAQEKECIRKRTRMDEVPCQEKNAPLLRADWRD